MPSDRSDPLLFSELRESAGKIITYVADHSADSFRGDPMTRDAFCMRLIVIGKAANRLTSEGKAILPNLSWDRMASPRHLLAHGHGAASPTLLWSIATVNRPDLMTSLSSVAGD